MRVPGIALLLADTMRSRAYVQALAHHGMTADAAMIVCSPDRPRWGQATAVDTGRDRLADLFVPDLSVPLTDSVAEVTPNVAQSDGGTVNAQEVVRWISDARPELIVFSGFGGEIAGQEVLGAGPPLLHLHSGWLPDYRGSTTLYYSYLREGACGVTAILLSEDIDTGPIVRRKRYPPPPPGMDVDYCYDSAIRADLLVEVLREWAANEGLPPVTEQPRDGTTYYIIHPVLKHVALNSLNQVTSFPGGDTDREDP